MDIGGESSRKRTKRATTLLATAFEKKHADEVGEAYADDLKKDDIISALEAEKKPHEVRTINEDDEDEGQPQDEICPICMITCDSIDDGNGNLRLCCLKCGLVTDVIGDDRPNFDARQEAKSYTADPTKAETINPLMPHASMSTEITYNGRLAYAQYQMIKLNRWSSMSALERSLYIVFNKLEKACTQHHVPTGVQYTAKWLFKRVYEYNLTKQRQGQKREGLRGPKRDGLIAACVYMAFKASGLYWTKARVAQIFDLQVGEIRRGIAIFHELNKDKELPENLSKITGGKQYIHWFAIGLQLSRSISNLCCKLYKLLSKQGVCSSKQPQSVATGCLWVICQILEPKLSIEKVVAVTGISKNTIKEVIRLMGGFERGALISIFAEDMCETLGIANKLTRAKILKVSKLLCAIIDKQVYNNLWNLACFSVYFVLTINGVLQNDEKILAGCRVKQSEILIISKHVIYYRDAIIEECANFA